MEKSLLNFLKDADFSTLVDGVAKAAPAHMYQAFFPEQVTPSLKWESILNSDQYATAAPVISFGDAAPVAARRQVEKLSGDIPPIAFKRSLPEEYIINLNNVNYRQAIISRIFDDAMWCTESIKYRLDFMALQLLSSGKITLDSDTNADGIVETLDYKLSTWQKVYPGTVWSSISTATPLTNLYTWCKALRDKGFLPNAIWMTRTEFQYLKTSTEFITTYKALFSNGKVQTAWLGLAAVNEIITNNDLPPIYLIDDMIDYQKANGTLDVVRRAWKTSTVAITSGTDFGKTLFAPTAEEIIVNKNYMLAKAGNIAVQKYSIPDPIQEWTKAKAVAFPVWSASNKIIMANTNSTSAF